MAVTNWRHGLNSGHHPIAVTCLGYESFNMSLAHVRINYSMKETRLRLKMR
jgi:hypothetical protein